MYLCGYRLRAQHHNAALTPGKPSSFCCCCPSAAVMGSSTVSRAHRSDL